MSGARHRRARHRRAPRRAAPRRSGAVVLALVALALVTIVGAGLALARPGGGEGFSGGGGHGGGGGGDDGGWIIIIDLLFRLIILCFEYPAVGLPLLGILVVALVIGGIWNAKNRDWNSGPPVHLQHNLGGDDRPRRDLRELDPDFSWVLFEDFAFRLFATAHGARGNPARMAALAPYVAESARAHLLAREPAGAPTTRVVVGALRVFRVALPPGGPGASAGAKVHIGVEYEANTTTQPPGGPAHTWYTVERWGFARTADARTRPPGASRDFPCPNCGAPWASRDAGGDQRCASCDQIVDNGRFDWQVVGIELVHADPRPPTVTHEVPERGTDLPTYTDPQLGGAWQSLITTDPGVTRESFFGRVDLCYRTLNDAWSKNDLRPARGFVSDGLYDYLAYWTDAYAAQGLRNALDDMRVTRINLAKVVRDRWYDAVTVRVWGTGKDYVVDRAGHVVRGSRTRERPYSEYWTFVRSSARRGKVTTDPTCPNCGAPLSIGMAGTCDHCGVHVTAGEFDWVLSKIEQDDTYRG